MIGRPYLTSPRLSRSPVRVRITIVLLLFLATLFHGTPAASFTRPGNSAVQLVTSSLPEGNTIVPYHATLTAQGGSGNYIWSISAGKLPPGLKLDSTTGVIEGTPVPTGSFTFAAKVIDTGDGSTSTVTFRINITQPSGGNPLLPQAFIATNFPRTAGYTVTPVAAGGDLQAAINNASCNPAGTVLRLASGATFAGNYKLPAKMCAPGQWIIIRTDTGDSNLPGPEARIDPSYSPVLAKIITLNTSAAIATSGKAAFYWFMGVEMGVDPSVSLNYGVIVVGNKETQSSNLPHHIYIDRCYVHGNATGEISRGLQANGTRVAAINSYFENFHSTQFDAQAIAAWNTTGPLKIVNNFLEGSGENVILGGADPAIPNAIPSDIEIRLNHFFKPLTWKPDDPSYGGIHWAVKNLLEFKNAQRVLVDGNILENNWADAQDGFGILFTPRNQGGTCPWCTVANITLRYNLFQHSASGWNIGGSDIKHPSQPSQFISIHDNLMLDINNQTWGGDGKLFQIGDGPNGSNLLPPHDIIIDHNTGFQTWNILTVGDQINNPMLNFVFTNNINPHNSYGISGTGTGPGNSTIQTYFLLPIITANVMEALPSQIQPSQYPSGNFFPPDWTTVQFVDFTNGDYRLRSTSPYYNAGLDGEDLGGDVGAVAAATVGVVH
jgi:hypothetical protein